MAIPEKAFIDYVVLAGAYNWDPALTNQQHRQELMQFFQPDPNTTKSDIRDVLSECFGHKPDRFLRTGEERTKALELSQKAQEVYATIFADRAETVYNNLGHRPPEEVQKVFADMSRATQFAFRPGTSAEDLEFNNRLIDAASKFKQDPDPLRKILLDEVNKLREDLGLNDPENIKKLHSLSDAELVEAFPKYDRYLHLVAEVAEGGGKNVFTAEQHEELMKHEDMFSLNSTWQYRMNLMVNPYYADIKVDDLFAQNPDASKASEVIENMFGLSYDAPKHHLANLFESAQYLHNLGGVTLTYSLPLLNPALEGVFKNPAELTPYLSVNAPIVALGNDGEQYVISNKPVHHKIPTAQEYSEELLAAAVKADKWLLTGSKQFDTMMRAQKALNEARDEGVSAEQLQQLAKNLEKAAKEYLEYKDPDFKEYTGPSSVRGKNMREQSRLEAAGNILNYAKAQVESMPKLIEREAAAKQAAQQREEALKQDEAILRNAFDKNSGFLNFLDNLPAATSAALPRKVPTVDEKQKVKIDDAVMERMVTVPLVPQDQFSALCALACGSDKVHATIWRTKKVNGEAVMERKLFDVKGADGKVTQKMKEVKVKEKVVDLNRDPAGTFKAAMEAIVKGPDTLNALPKESNANAMITAAQSNAFHALQDGKFDELGKMVADGLKTNNDLMREQLGFTSTFSAGANLIGKALQAMDKNPALKEAVEKNLDPTQLQIAKGIKALGDMQADGLQAQLEVLNHLRLPGANLDDPAFRENVAKVCSMYGMSKQFAGKQVNLVNLANDPQYPKNITSALAQNQTLTNFIEGLKTKSLNDQFKAISTPKEMSKLFDAAAANAKQQVNQQNQPQIEFHLQAAQPQAAQPQQPQHSGPV